MACISIELFDRVGGKSGVMVVKAYRVWDLEQDDSSPDFELDIVFEEFVKKVRAGIPPPKGIFDVCISLSDQQGSFVIPKSFFDLIHENGWKVYFFLN